MMEQTIHSSCSLAHARPLAAMHRAVTAHVPATATAATTKVSCPLFTAHSLLVRCRARCWLNAVVVRHISADVDDESGYAYRP